MVAKRRKSKPKPKSKSRPKPKPKKVERKPVKGFEVELMECGKPTDNGNIYPSEVMANAIAEANSREDFWVTVPPEGETRVRLRDVIGRAKMSIFEDKVSAHIQLLDTPRGEAIKKLMDEGAPVRFLTRGCGPARDDDSPVVSEGFRLDCIVAELEK